MNLKQQIIIRYLNGDSQRKISEELHTSRNTIRKYVNEYNFKKQELLNNNNLTDKNQIIDDIVAKPTYNSSNRTRRKISNDCIDLIKQCLIENKKKRASGKAKQQLKATDIYEILIDKGFNISYSSVSNIVRSLKDTLNEAYIKQEYSLGDVCEFDWGEVKLNINNKGLKKYQIAVFTSAYGNYRFAVLFETQDTIAFQQAHALFFEHIGGIYNSMVYDNMKVAVAKFVGHHEKEATKGLLMLSTYYGFNFRFCNIRSGNEKGHVIGIKNCILLIPGAFLYPYYFELLKYNNKNSDNVKKINVEKSFILGGLAFGIYLIFVFLMAFAKFGMITNIIKAILVTLIVISSLSSFLYSIFITFGKKLGTVINIITVIIWQFIIPLGVMGAWTLMASIRIYIVLGAILTAYIWYFKEKRERKMLKNV